VFVCKTLQVLQQLAVAQQPPSALCRKRQIAYNKQILKVSVLVHLLYKVTM
jgi:hypothetical protein